MASTKIVQKGRSKRSTTKSSSHLRFPPHPFLKIHRTSPSKVNLQELRTSGRCARVSTRRYLKAKANEATVHQKYCLHQRQRNPRPPLTLHLFIWCTAFWSHLNDRKTTERPTPSLRGGHRTSFCVQLKRILSYKGAQKFSSLSHKTQESGHQCNRGDDRRFMTQ